MPGKPKKSGGYIKPASGAANGVSADQNRRSASHQDARWPALEACAPIFDRDLALVRDPGLKAACALRDGYWSPPSGAGVCLDRAEDALGLSSDGNRPD